MPAASRYAVIRVSTPQVSTLDIKNGISEYRKLKGHNPDIVIVDSMDLLTDANRRSWGADHERAKAYRRGQ